MTRRLRSTTTMPSCVASSVASSSAMVSSSVGRSATGLSISMTPSTAPGIDKAEIGCADLRGGFGGGLRARKKRRRRLPEDRAADGKAGGGAAVGRRGEPSLDGREVGGFAEDDLPAL